MRPFRPQFLVGALLIGLSIASGFRNVVRGAAPDPAVVYAQGFYHMTYTSSDHIEIVRSRTLSGLLIGKVRTVWTDANETRNAFMWAPEIHQIDSVWYIFYSSGAQPNTTADCRDTCRTRVLRGCRAGSPFYCNYKHRADLLPPSDKQGGSDGNDAFAIDGTFLEIPGRGRYHVVSAYNDQAVQAIQITELNTRNWTVSGWNVISEPEQEWEQNTTNARTRELWPGDIAVNEAPHPLYHDGQIWLSFSASHCQTPNYALGLLHYTGGDPLMATSWRKTGPVLSQANGNFGTGHNCFFKSPDGTETWTAFHATDEKIGSCGDNRYTIAQKVQFTGNNTPTFAPPLGLDDASQLSPSGENTTAQIMDEGEFVFDRDLPM